MREFSSVKRAAVGEIRRAPRINERDADRVAMNRGVRRPDILARALMLKVQPPSALTEPAEHATSCGSLS